MTADFPTNQISQKDPNKLLWECTLNSLMAFLISYQLMFAITHLCQAYIGSIYGYFHTLYHYGNSFKGYNGQWSRMAVVSIYASGPALNFIIGIVFMRLYFVSYKKPGIMKYLYLWGNLMGFVFSFGYAAVGAFTKSGVAYAFRWAHFPYPLIIVIGVVSCIILLAIGMGYINHFMYLSPSLDLIDEGRKKIYIRHVVVLPFLLALPVLFALEYPLLIIRNTLLAVSPALIVLPLWGRSLKHHGSYGIAAEPNYKISPILIALLVVVLGGWLLLTANGGFRFYIPEK